MDNPSMSTSISEYAYHGVSSTVGAVNEGALTLSEGIISTLPRVSSRVLFYPSLIYTMLMEKFSSRDWYNRVDENLIIGAIPFKSMTQLLVDDEKLGAVVSVNEDFERWYTTPTKEEWESHQVTLLHFNVGDYIHTPSLVELEQSVELITATAQQNKTTYVHCKAGRTRSATVCCAYLLKRYNYTVEEAIEKLERARPHIVLRDVHKNVLNQFYEQIHTNTETEIKPEITENDESIEAEIDNSSQSTSNL
jgi:atypical dual specificity phosphatase